MRGYGPETFGELYADQYDAELKGKMETTTEQSVEVLADLANGGTVLELAIGTGRVALPLAARGLTVHGIEASEPMVQKLREKPGGQAIPVTIGDMADVAVDGSFDLVFLIFNTLFNLTSQEAQVRCFQNVARRLTPGGLFVVKAFLPDLHTFVDDQSVRAMQVEVDGVRLDVRKHDPVTQTIRYQRIRITSDGTRAAPLVLRYAWPSELDLMARLAGMTLRDRWGGWDRSPFNAASIEHVSVYALND